MELLRTMFDNPHFLRLPGRLNAVLRGLTADWSQDNDEWVVVTNHLFQVSYQHQHIFLLQLLVNLQKMCVFFMLIAVRRETTDSTWSR